MPGKLESILWVTEDVPEISGMWDSKVIGEICAECEGQTTSKPSEWDFCDYIGAVLGYLGVMFMWREKEDNTAVIVFLRVSIF